MSRMIFRLWPVLILLGIAAGTLILFSGANSHNVIKERQANFRTLSHQMRDIIQGLGDGLPVSAMRHSANSAQLALQRVPGLFPKDSGHGKTRALPSIWLDPARFRLVYEAATARMDELVAAAQSDDRNAFGAAAGRMAAACGDCHKSFRSD